MPQNNVTSSLDELRSKVLAGGLSRRDVLKRSLALGLSAPVIAGLLAACGDPLNTSFCTACYGGGYPIPVTAEAETKTEREREPLGV